MSPRLSNRTAIVTGSSSGLGKATALLFAASGAKVLCADLQDTGVADEIIAKHGANAAAFVKCDVTQETEIQGMVQKAVDFGGRLDILCNFAGIGVEGRLGAVKNMHEMKTEDFDETWNINVRGTWICGKYAVTQMLAQEPLDSNARGDRTRGWIVNVSSAYGFPWLARERLTNTTQGFIGQSSLPAYVPSKHAVVGITRQMAANYAPDRIHVNSVCPGFVATPLVANLMPTPADEAALAGLSPWNALGTPEDVAKAALFLCSDDASFVTGHALSVDGGMTIV